MDIQSKLNLKLLTFREASRRLGISAPTIYSLIDGGHIKITTVGNRKYIKESDLYFHSAPKRQEEQTYYEFESSLRSAVRRGHDLNVLFEEFLKTKDPPSISNFALFLFNKGISQDFLKGAINLKF